MLLTQGHLFPAGFSDDSHFVPPVPRTTRPGDEVGFLLDAQCHFWMTFLL